MDNMNPPSGGVCNLLQHATTLSEGSNGEQETPARNSRDGGHPAGLRGAPASAHCYDSSDDEFEDAIEMEEAMVSTRGSASSNARDGGSSPPPPEQDDAEPDVDVCVGDDDSDGEIRDPPARIVTNMESSRQTAFEEGYDSDGEAPPIDNTREEMPLLPDEPTLGETPQENGDQSVTEEPMVEAPPMVPVAMPDDELAKMTVPNIKVELKIRNVTHASRMKRPELLERLRQSLGMPVIGTKEQMNESKSKKGEKKKERVDDPSEFAPGAHWRALKPKEEAAQEPTNPSFKKPRAPTVPEADASKPQVVKHDFSETFDRPPFKGTRTVPKKGRDGKITGDDEGDPVTETIPRTRGGPKPEFLKRHNLDEFSHPAEFFEAFLPKKMNRHRNSSNAPHLSISETQQWTNLKAVLSSAGTDDCHKDYKPFSVKEIQQHLGLYILNGLSPSPSIDLKFDVEDEANFNHFVHSGVDNGIRRHRHFRAFLSVQDPRKAVPPRSRSPLFKLLPPINWMNAIGKISWDLSIHLSADEQTISFQGRHIDKLRVTHKAEGDGFQVDALCDRGFTHSICFRNEKPPTEHTRMGLSPSHARVMWLFDGMEEEFTRVWMDGLCISAKFAKFSYNHPKKVMMAGVGRKNGRGIPASVVQDEAKDANASALVRGTVKAAVLEGDKDMPNLVAVSVCDTKPAHFISTVCESIEWVLPTRKVWNESKERMDKLQFLRLNVNNDCNNDMNSVDTSDQSRNDCRFDHWLRNFKWWWAMLLWGVGVLLVNSCVCCTDAMEMAGIPKKNRLTHCQCRHVCCCVNDFCTKKLLLTTFGFRLAIARVWMSKDGDGILRRWRERHRGDTGDTAPLVSGNKRARSPAETPSPLSFSVGTVDSYGSAPSDGTPKKKSPRITDEALKPGGRLKERLDHFGGGKHLPISRDAAGKTFNTKCALHRWAIGRECEFRRGIMICSDCRVPLCLDCFSICHTEEDLCAKKEELRDKMDGEISKDEERARDMAAAKAARKQNNNNNKKKKNNNNNKRKVSRRKKQ